MIPIKHLMHIKVKIEEVFSALSDENKLIEWYTTGVVGNFEKNNIVSFEFVNFATFKFKIIAFEPMPQTFNELIKIKKNYPNRFYINRIGLGQKKAQKHIYFDKNNLELGEIVNDVRIISLEYFFLKLWSYQKKCLKKKYYCVFYQVLECNLLTA